MPLFLMHLCNILLQFFQMLLVGVVAKTPACVGFWTPDKFQWLGLGQCNVIVIVPMGMSALVQWYRVTNKY